MTYLAGGGRRRSFWLLLVLFLASSSIAWPQVVERSATSQISIGSKVNDISETLKRLEEAWAKHKVSLEEAEKTLAELRNRLTSLQAHLTASEAAVKKSTDSYNNLQADFAALQTTFDEYKKAAQTEIVRTAFIWLLIGLAAGAAAGIIFD